MGWFNSYKTLVKNFTTRYSMEIMLVIICIAAVVGLSSVIITGKEHNEVEQISEQVIDKELGLPSGTVDLDFYDLSKKIGKN
jgi:hypothetical protein